MTRRQCGRLKTRFLEAFRKSGNVTLSCDATGIARSTLYKWQEYDGTFAGEYRQAEIEATEYLEGEARRRAVEGVETHRPIYGRDGHLIDTIVETKYSDTLLIFLLKARAPEKYRERQSVEHSGPGGGPIHNEIEHRGLEVRAVDYRLTAAPLRPDEEVS